jgi:hypothetical protein|tara:strand:+ start:50 stop:253 length:204 start_codon:yes stop_codon:yes gene_type:complete
MAWRQDEVRNRWEWECEPDEDDDDVPQAVVDTFLQERQAIALETVAAALIQINEKLSGIEMNMRPTP